MSKENIMILDTTSLYVEFFSEESDKSEKENPEILIFHNDGYFESQSKKYFNKFKEDRNKKSIYYGGKFILNSNPLGAIM